MFDSDHASDKAAIDVDYRPLWKQTKAKHQKAIEAKKLKFGEDLGPQLDKLSAANSALSSPGKMKLKRVKMTTQEQNETSPSKRKSIRATLIANDKSNQVIYKRRLKTMYEVCVTVKRVAESYKSKIKGLGNPAENDLDDVLDKILTEIEKQVRDTKKLELKFNDSVSNPHRLDHLK